MASYFITIYVIIVHPQISYILNDHLWHRGVAMGLDPQMVEELQDLSPEELHKEVRKFGMLRSNFLTKKRTQERQKHKKHKANKK